MAHFQGGKFLDHPNHDEFSDEEIEPSEKDLEGSDSQKNHNCILCQAEAADPEYMEWVQRMDVLFKSVEKSLQIMNQKQ